MILAVVDARTDSLLGACDLRIEPHGLAELGYMLGAHARGQGAMTKAVLLLSEWAFTRLAVERIRILAHPENEASIAVAVRVAFQREGSLPGYREKKGRREDRLILSKTVNRQASGDGAESQAGGADRFR